MANRKKKLRGKYVFRRFLLVLLVLGLAGTVLWYGKNYMVENLPALNGPDDSEDSTTTPETQPMPANPDLESAEPEPEAEPEETQIPQGDTEDWNLILVNPWTSLPDNFQVQLETIYDTTNDTYKVDARIADEAIAMFNQARLDGISLFPCSAYRTFEYQEGLFEKQINQQIATGKSQEEAVAAAALLVAVPGTSEHQTGLAIDIVTEEYQVLDEGFAQTPAFRWLQENAYKYGFILRFPDGRTDVTGISYEPWHYRYVGVEHAEIIRELNLTLEEYLQILERGGFQTVELEDEDTETDDSEEQS